jgi:hypothetical protein
VRSTKQNWRPSLSSFFQPTKVSVFVSSTTMPPQLDAATHVLIESLLKEEFETKLIALEASCSLRTAQRERRKRNQSEMPTPRTNRAGRYSYITSSMQEALLNKLIKKPYLYRCEIADFFYRRFRQRVSERSIGRLLRSKG